MTGQELWASLLQEAIQGRLVEQRDDEPAVEQIGDAPEDVPFAIPEKWKWVRLGDVGSWKAGATPSRSNSTYYSNAGIPWLKTGDLNDGIITTVPECITQKALDETSVRLNPKGSVLIAMYGATIGKIGLLGIDCTTNQACCACIVNKKTVYNWWLFYYLLSQRNNFISLGAGGAQPNISKEKITSYPIPLPPLAEQRRIVARLEELRPLVDDYGAAEAELTRMEAELPDKLRASLLQEAIQGRLVPQNRHDEPASTLLERIRIEKSKLVKAHKIKKEKPLPPITKEEMPYDLPENWKWVRLGDVCQKITDGSHNPPPNTGYGYPVISAKNIKNGTITFDNVDRYTDETGFLKENPRTNISNGDIIMGIIGGSIGNLAIYTHSRKVIAQRSIAIIQTILVINIYIKLFFESTYAQRKLREKSFGTAQGGVYLGQLQNMVIPLPPLAEQRRIVARLEELLPEVAALIN